MKLSAKEIEFIDNYLDNSGVSYADIRMEITDHVASQIENTMQINKEVDFYDVFKAYMVKDKAGLLKENKRFINTVTKQNAKLIIKELLALRTIILFLALVFLSNYFINNLSLDAIKLLFAIPLFLMVPLAIAYFICSKKYNFSRFSGVERLAFMFTILFHICHLTSIIMKPNIEAGISTIYISTAFVSCIILIYSFIKVSINIIQSYLLRYKNIA